MSDQSKSNSEILHITRRQFLGTAFPVVIAANAFAARKRRFRLLLRSSWQTVNIGDIAHTPGMLPCWRSIGRMPR